MLGQIYVLITILTFLILKFDKSLGVELLKSYILSNGFDEKWRNVLIVLYSIISPITLPKIILIKYKNNEISKFMKYIYSLIAIFLLICLVYSGTKSEVEYYNKSVGYSLKLEQKKNSRLIVLDKMTKCIHQQLQLAGINDSSYYKNLYVVALSRSDNPALLMKWVGESNPNANFSEVAEMYKSIAGSISTYRNELEVIEREMSEIQFNYAEIHKTVPGKFLLCYQNATLEYTPIATSANRIINATGVDDNISLK